MATLRVLNLGERDFRRGTGEDSLNTFVQSLLGDDGAGHCSEFADPIDWNKHELAPDTSPSYTNLIAGVVWPGLARGEIILLKAGVLRGA